MNRVFIRKREIFVIAALVIAAALFLILSRWRAAGAYAQVNYRGGEIARIDLRSDGQYRFDQAPGVTLEVWYGGIAFIVSDCPDQICVRTGFISRVGQTAVCLPNRLAVKIVGAGATDAITY